MNMPITGETLTAEHDLVLSTVGIVAAYVGQNALPIDELPDLIKSVHEALSALGEPAAPPEPTLEPAVTVRASVKPDHITCLDCGSKQKMLKRHLQTAHQLTPEEYRARWSLPADYPLVAPNYAAKRRELALSIGLGRKPGGKA